MAPNRPQNDCDDDAPLVDPGRNLGLRLLALLGAFSFLMLGLASVLIPLLQSPPPSPSPTLPRQPSSA
ncbi:MAG: hypothetical protein VKM98_02995 [Cyanobacteriota bacterium]|nr:hypothetical protein [Cyanobacteriota bacterium]